MSHLSLLMVVVQKGSFDFWEGGRAFTNKPACVADMDDRPARAKKKFLLDTWWVLEKELCTSSFSQRLRFKVERRFMLALVHRKTTDWSSLRAKANKHLVSMMQLTMKKSKKHVKLTTDGDELLRMILNRFHLLWRCLEAGGNETIASALMVTYTTARLAHTYSYAKSLQPARGICWAIGITSIVGGAVNAVAGAFL